jgi:ribulose-bisphosphate carboxylase large chain
MNQERIEVLYRLHVPHEHAAQRAQILALEQSIEMPLEAVLQPRIREEVVAQVVEVKPDGPQHSLARLHLATATVGVDAGQLLNMVFGNSSLHDDVEVVDLDLPPALAQAFGGPNHGIEGVRRLTETSSRPLTATALKPICSTVEEIAALCRTFAAAGIDLIKDDHGWAEQSAAPFRARVAACQQAIAQAADARGGRTLYAPSLSGSLSEMQAQIDFGRAHGVRVFLIAPMVAGVANFHALTRAARDVVFLAHPALAGQARFAPPLLLGKLFRLFGADAVIFPNHGGRFSYSRATCHAISQAARAPWRGLTPALPVPAGGMTVERVPELAADYGRDCALLIGGGLLSAREALAARARAFVEAVHALSEKRPESVQ